MADKRVYTFGNGLAEGNASMRNLLGGKGANLAEMNLIGIPTALFVPSVASNVSLYVPVCCGANS